LIIEDKNRKFFRLIGEGDKGYKERKKEKKKRELCSKGVF